MLIRRKLLWDKDLRQGLLCGQFCAVKYVEKASITATPYGTRI